MWRQPPFTLPTYIKIQMELNTGALFRRFHPNHTRTAPTELLLVRQRVFSSERFYFRLSLRRKNMIKLIDHVMTNRTGQMCFSARFTVSKSIAILADRGRVG